MARRAANPSVVVIAGPNGAGKSTIAPAVLGDVGVDHFVNADVIARGLSALSPESVALSAGRIMLERLRELAARRESFAFETTLASRSFAPMGRGAHRGRLRLPLGFRLAADPRDGRGACTIIVAPCHTSSPAVARVARLTSARPGGLEVVRGGSER